MVLETENVAAGIAAAIAFDPQADLDANVEQMTEAYSSVKCAQVTSAVRSTKMDGLSLTKGDVIGLSEKKILVKGSDLNAVTLDLVKKMQMDSMDVLNVYAGEGVSEETVADLTEKLGEAYPDLEVIPYRGDQPHSFYILAAE